MPSEKSEIYLLGIRHHGPGSARSVQRALTHLQPDALLVEGPPEGDALLPLAADEGMDPPVALLVHASGDAQQAVYYPFARFSPEWQAIQFGHRAGVPVSFMDLPQAHRFALDAEETIPVAREPEEETGGISWRGDPIGYLAEAAGHGDGERWWEEMVEERDEGLPVFAAIQDAMTALREVDNASPPERIELLREAWMRKSIRAAMKRGYKKIAVVCGAWHVPALANLPTAKEDDALLKGLPKVKVDAAWTPWTYGRLTRASGYGAGVAAPGWYDHLWDYGGNADRGPLAVRWLTRAARILREADLDASSAHVIEAVRLAESLAAVRQRPITGLPELDDAARAVFALGSEAPMALIRSVLYTDDRLGSIPPGAPLVPLARDLGMLQKRLRMKPSPLESVLDLDLRKETDRDRSCLLHRLSLLGIPWGEANEARGRVRGTFHELWTLQWKPEFAVSLIGASVWGGTVAQAAEGCVRAEAARTETLPELAHLMHAALAAQLPQCIAAIESAIELRCAASGDVGELMDTTPHLAAIMRYGDVRKTDSSATGALLIAINARICAGLVAACKSLNDEAAEAMLGRIVAANDALKLLESPEEVRRWQEALSGLADATGIHGLLHGRCCRILFDDGAVNTEEIGHRMELALSRASDTAEAGAWLDGCLRDSGIVLVHDHQLLTCVDRWMSGLSHLHFGAVVPLLRRVFSSFTAPERFEIGQRLRSNAPSSVPQVADFESDIDTTRAERVLPLMCHLMGIADPGGVTR